MRPDPTASVSPAWLPRWPRWRPSPPAVGVAMRPPTYRSRSNSGSSRRESWPAKPRAENLIADCMKAQGFDYVPVDPQAQRAALVGQAGMSEEEFNKQFGYGITTLFGKRGGLAAGTEPGDPRRARATPTRRPTTRRSTATTRPRPSPTRSTPATSPVSAAAPRRPTEHGLRRRGGLPEPAGRSSTSSTSAILADERMVEAVQHVVGVHARRRLTTWSTPDEVDVVLTDKLEGDRRPAGGNPNAETTTRPRWRRCSAKEVAMVDGRHRLRGASTSRRSRRRCAPSTRGRSGRRTPTSWRRCRRRDRASGSARRRPRDGPVDAPVVELAGVSRTFGADPPVHALRGVDLSIWPGEWLAIVGPSGSGKSTLLNIVGLLDRQTSGTYRFDGRRCRRARRPAPRRAPRAPDRVRLPGVPPAPAPQRARERDAGRALRRRAPARPARAGLAALDRVGLDDRADFLPTRLSGGQQQRAAIARALMGEPSLLLCDEPTGNLDSQNADSVLDVFAELSHDGLTLAVITHDEHVASRADRRVRIIDGVLNEVPHRARCLGRTAVSLLADRPAPVAPVSLPGSSRPKMAVRDLVDGVPRQPARPPGPGRAHRARHGRRRRRARGHPRAVEDGRQPDRRPLRRAGRHRHRRHAEDRIAPAGP